MPNKKAASAKSKKEPSESKPIPKPKKPWNVFIYMAGDNNLLEESIWALTEMRKGRKKTSSINLKVQFDHGLEETYFDFSPSTKKTIAGGLASGSRASSRFIRDLDQVDVQTQASLPETTDSLKSFIARSSQDTEKGLLKSGHGLRVLILAGHSTSDPLALLKTLNPQTQISLPDLRALLEEHEDIDGKLDILGLDSCSMSSVETIFELRDNARFLVSAQGYEDNTGWPYRQILAALEKGGSDAESAAARIVSEYTNFYGDYVTAGISSDLAACNLDEQRGLQTAIKALADVLLADCDEPTVQQAILLSHWRAQSYKSELTVDLWDFCKLLEEACPHRSNVLKACSDVRSAVESCVVLNSYTGAASQHSHGISIYFPWATRDWMQDRDLYKTLRFAADTHWDEFLDKFLPLTQRDPREPSPENGKIGDAETWIMPLDGMTAADYRTDPNIRTRTDPNIRTRTDPNIRTRTDPNIRTRADSNIGTHGKVRVLHVKNPAEIFYRCEEECKL